MHSRRDHLFNRTVLFGWSGQHYDMFEPITLVSKLVMLFFANIFFVNCLARAILGRGFVSLQHTKFVNCSSNPTCEISVSLRGSTYCGGGSVSAQRLAIYDSEFIHCQSKNFNLLACIPAGLRWVATPPLTNESCWRIAFQSGRAKSGKLSCDSKS